MKLILLRHGDRSPGFSDVPLSDKGHKQAYDLTHNDFILKAQKILASPKKRAQQTITPLAQHKKLPIETISELDQMRDIESPQDFAHRVQTFLQQLPPSSEEIWLLCSHSDWLQQAVFLMAENDEDLIAHSFFSCAEFKIFEYKNQKWTNLKSL